MNQYPHAHRARQLGAAAGLAPAGVALVMLAVLGASPSRDAALWLGVIAVVALAAGWLIGPRVTGAFPSDLLTAVAYALVGSLSYLVVGVTVSIWAGPAIDGDVSSGLAWRVAGQLAYGLLYLPFLIVVLTPFGILWVIVVRALRRPAGLGPSRPPTRDATRDLVGTRFKPGRLGVFAALLIVAYGGFVAALPFVVYHDPTPPWAIYRPLALVVLFAIPAAVALVGAVTRRRSLLVVAGVVCLVQSYVSFSLVTLGFIVPALLLLALGVGERWPTAHRETRLSVVASIAVVGLTVGAWVATLGLTEEVCWSATRAPDGTLTYERIPVTDDMTVPPGGFASGCDGGTLTLQGMGVGAVFAAGAIAVATASAWARRGGVDPG